MLLLNFWKQEQERIANLNDNEEHWQAWCDHYWKLTPKEQAIAQYLLSAAKKVSDAEEYLGVELGPITCVAQKNVNNGFGIIFSINRDCFLLADTKLFYVRSDMWIPPTVIQTSCRSGFPVWPMAARSTPADWQRSGQRLFNIHLMATRPATIMLSPSNWNQSKFASLLELPMYAGGQIRSARIFSHYWILQENMTMPSESFAAAGQLICGASRLILIDRRTIGEHYRNERLASEQKALAGTKSAENGTKCRAGFTGGRPSQRWYDSADGADASVHCGVASEHSGACGHREPRLSSPAQSYHPGRHLRLPGPTGLAAGQATTPQDNR